MTYRNPRPAPASTLPEERRGRVLGRFCRACGAVYPRFAGRHQGKPTYGKDHIAAPCSHEGDEFAAGEGWWEPAIEVLPAAEPEAG